jgi:predicted phage baseplate assembly protein
MSAEKSVLNECGCCEGVETITPESLENRPGLSTLVYRVGTYSSFKKSMHAALSKQSALRNLTTRLDDDPSMALMDGWAVVLDVLSFYQERIANEGFLSTATERRSLLEMARSIGYELRPGVAAGTYLAFTLETAPGAPLEATIAIGAKGQSIPGQDELPQTFETVEEITAKVAWNALKPRQTELVLPKLGDTTVYLKGTSTNLKPGDALLLIGDERKTDSGNENWDFRRVKMIETDTDRDHTMVTCDRGLGSTFPFFEPAKENPKVYVFRQRAAIFGHNAQAWATLPVSLRVGEISPEDQSFIQGPFYGRESSWANANFAEGTTQIDLDAVYSQIVVDSWIVLAKSGDEEVFSVTKVEEKTKSDYLMSAKITCLTLSGENIHYFSPQNASVYAQSELLEMAEKPITDVISGDVIVLDQEIEGLTAGQLMIVSGTKSDTDESVSEIGTLDDKALENGYTKLFFTTALQNSYQRDSVTINANVARATHGETKTEVLGSGDGSQSFQKFVLKQTPITYVSAATPSGAETTLEVRVNDLLWEEVPTLYGVLPDERVYITRIADDGKVSVCFGDNITGARLPTGVENVKAIYRVGTGLDGMVDAEQISLLMTRPLGVQGVINPFAPTGAADPEERDDARQNAPLTVLTLDRIVSLRDFEDFTRAFSGIGKAQATLLWNGERRMVHITVADTTGKVVESDSDLYRNLIAGIDLARHSDQTVQVDSHESLTFNIDAKVWVQPDFIAADVLTDVQEALVSAFSFETRSFGQAVTKGEVLAVMQAVSGVIAVDLATLYFTSSSAVLSDRLPVQIAHWDNSTEPPTIKRAELLLIDPDGIIVTEMTE